MNVLIIGSGAREHALAWMFSNSKSISEIFIAPGNAGTKEIGTNFDNVDPLDFDAIAQLSRGRNVDLVFVGPEAPLAAGIVDHLKKFNLNVIGPGKEPAQLEGSKSFSKDFMIRHGIPTAQAESFSDYTAYEEKIKNIKGKVVIKKSGLAEGKGVLESDDKHKLLEFGKNILASDTLLVEEFLEGYELSVFIVMDGEDYVLLPPCADHKKANENDVGPNTGGMGAVCPVYDIKDDIMRQIEKEIVIPTFKGLKKDNLCYKGFLFIGVMVTNQGPKVLEYNVRLGDPESQVLLPILRIDMADLCEALLNGNLKKFSIPFRLQTAVGITVASEGYPGKYKKGVPVAPIPIFPENDALIFHSSTKINEKGQLVTGGGRCFTAVGLHKDIRSAAKRAYEVVSHIKFDGAWYRKDIARRFS